ncbi:MAG: MFS transporter [Candidatus Thorarchaeota archaeon]
MSSFSNSKENIKDQKGSFKLLEFVIYLLFFFGPLTGNVIVVLFHALSSEFKVLEDAILVAIPAFMFPFAITQLFSGVLSDLKGRFPVLIIGLILFGAAMLLATLSFSLIMYIIANVMGGIGFGLINPTLIALMTDITDPPNIPKKMGYLGASANLGVGLGPLIASQMIFIGWRSIYILFIVIALFGLIYSIISARPPQKIPKESSFKVLFSQLSKELRRIVVLLMIFSAVLISHTYLAINIWTSRILSGQESIVGIILGIAGIGSAITGILTGIVTKKKGVGIPIIIGSILLIISLTVFIGIRDISRTENFPFLAVGWILAGLAGGILFPSITYYSQVLSPSRRGALAGLLTAGYFIGIALVPTTLKPILAMFGITGLYGVILGISVVFIIILFLLYLMARRIIVQTGLSSHQARQN